MAGRHSAAEYLTPVVRRRVVLNALFFEGLRGPR
jgi:hypothetical protein